MQWQISSTSLPLPLADGENATGDLGLAWSNDGSMIAVAKPGHPVRLWDPSKGVLLKILDRADPAVAGALIFSPDNSRLASILSNGKIQIWDCSSGKPLSIVSEGRFDSPVVGWSPDGSCIAVARQRALEIWESYSGSPSRRVDVGYDVTAVAWSSNSDLLAAAGRGIVKIWKRDLTQHANHRLVVADQSEVLLTMAWMAEQNRVIAGAGSGKIYCWDIARSDVDRTLIGHQDTVTGLAVSRDNRVLASKALDCTVRFWNLRDWSGIGQEEETSRKTHFPVIAFHPSLSLLASSDSEKNLVNIRSFTVGGRVASSSPLKIFFSYSRDDANRCKQLIEHLSVFEQNGRILCWYDQKISPGEQWDPRIAEQIDSCDIAVCLVSAAFMSSENCRRELDRILGRHKLHGLTILPVVLREVMFEQSSLATFQAGPLHKGRLKPVAAWAEKDKALAEAARWIMVKVDELMPPTR